MKNSLWSVLVFLSLPLSASAQVARVARVDEAPKISEPRVVERGPHHRVWERTITEKLRNGKTVERKSSFTELANGLHHLKDGQWVESREEIEVFPGGAIARSTAHQVIWSQNINTAGAIDLLTPDGKRFRSHIIGLAYIDAATGKSEMIAEIKDSIGELVGSNQVIYRDAFTDFRADVRYTHTRAEFEQDIILRENPPSPWEYGMNPATTRLEVWTEFIEAPEPVRGTSLLKQEGDIAVRRGMVDPDLTDERLEFGEMTMGPGRAFPTENESDEFSESFSTPVGKNWIRIDGRQFLIEKVDYRDVLPQLDRLPKSAAIAPVQRNQMQAARRGENRSRLLAAAKAPAPALLATTSPMRLAQITPRERGFVLDYTLMTSATNFTFQGGTTYYISGNVTLSGTTVIEGGVIVKYTNSILAIQGPVDCRADVYRPTFFMSKNDNTYGETIPGSTGNPLTNYYGSRCLDFTGNTNAIALHNLRFRHSFYAVYLNTGCDVTVRHSQFYRCFAGIVSYGGSKARLRNALIHDGEYAIGGTSLTNIQGEHLTAHRLKYLISSSSAYLTNSIVLAVTNLVKYTGANVLSNSVDTGYFQTLAGGARYLVNSSTNRNAGTTNINAGLLADLKRITTEPPKTLYDYFYANTNLSPVIVGDTVSGDLPDLGYHYSIIDYLASGAVVDTGVTVVATNGVNIAIDYSQNNFGFALVESALISQGSPFATNRIFRAHMVQETSTGNPGTRMMFYDTEGGFSQTAQARLRFTELIQLPSDGYILFTGTGFSALELSHSSIYGPSFVVDISGSSPLVCGATNSFWEGGGVQFGVGNYGTNTTVHLRNNLFRYTGIAFVGGTNTWTVRDNLFDSVSTNIYDFGSPVQNSFNAYYQSTNVNFSGGTSNLFLSSLAYETGPLSRYYLPTNSPLINAGSTSASSVGLYHFTTTTNQVKEGTSTNDIGLHFVALNGSNQPVDSDNDGIVDYVEDRNGNGVADGSETSAVNPVLTIASSLEYIKGGPGKRLDTNAIAYDTDSLNWGGGQLTVKNTSGAEVNDLLGFRLQGTNAGQINVSGTNISYGGTGIATYTGGNGTNTLIISFNTNALNASVQALVRTLTFQSVSNTPSISNRILSFTLSDGKGGTNMSATQTINIVCPDGMDLMLVMDVSNSMIRSYDTNCNFTTDSNRFWTAKAAASNFVASLNLAGGDRVGLIAFSGPAVLKVPLTNNTTVLQSNIYALSNSSGTELDDPINLAKTNLSNSASNVLRAMVILSDGEIYNGTECTPGSNIVAELEAARQAADAEIRIITVAFHTGECCALGGTNFLASISGSPRDYHFLDPTSLDYHYAPSFLDLASNFTAVAHSLCRGNEFPTVTITSPTNGASFNAPANVSITVEAFDDGTVTNVALFIGTTNFVNLTSSPYAVTWSNALGGNYALKAVAIDNTGQSSTSAVVNVTVLKQPPSITLVAPTDGARFAQVAALMLRAGVSDVDGTITNVVFYTNGVACIAQTNTPFRLPWTNLVAGTYSAYAKAWDNDGQTALSLTNTFYVDSCPQVGVSNLTLSSSSVPGGSNVTATITLSNAAPAGGQLVSIYSSSPNVSVPASLHIPAGTNTASLNIATYATVAGDSASITASTPLKTNSTTLTIQANALQFSRSAAQCGPMDVVFVIDSSYESLAGMDPIGPAVSNVVEGIKWMTGGDYQLALVTFAQNQVFVDVPFSLTNELTFRDAVDNLELVFDNCTINDPSIEALNTVINALPSSGRPEQVGEFTNYFRAEARKFIILMTDMGPLGFGTNYCSVNHITEPRVFDPAGGHQRAVEASLKGIQICTVLTPSHEEPAEAEYWLPTYEAALDYAFVTDGTHFAADAQSHRTKSFYGFTEEIHELGFGILSFLSQCGSDGEVVVTRDDLLQQNHPAITLNDGKCLAASLNSASFDLSGVETPVVEAQFQRTGRLLINHGSRFDLNLGVASNSDTNLAFFAPPSFFAQTNALGVAYATSWALPFPFYSDIQAQLGSIYSVGLMDRVSTICGNNFNIVDTPQSDWPSARNRLTFKTLSSFQVAQGRCRDFVLTGTNAPCGELSSICSGSWEVRRYNEVIASECAPHGWSVEPDYGVYGGVNVCAPIDALTSNGYEVRFDDGTNARSGYFSVVPATVLNTAPVLKPIELSNPVCSSNTLVTVTVSLDAPAQGDGAFVGVTCSGVTNKAIPSYLHISAGQTTVSFTFRPSPVTSDTSFEVVVSYNGERRAVGTVIQELSSMSSFEVATAVDSRRIAVDWEPVPGALYYALERGPDGFGPTETLAIGLTRTCYVDEMPNDGENCYYVTAWNNYDSVQSDWGLTSCSTFSANAVLRPRISPHGGRFNDFASVTISCETTNATIRYTLDGTIPSPTNGADYTNGQPLRLTSSAQLIAKAFVGGTWSLDDRADFHISQPTPLGCGNAITSVLANTNQPSVVKGFGWFGARYSFEGRRGDQVFVSVLSQSFDSDLNLRDPNGVLVAENDIAISTGLGIRPAIGHTLRTNGTYVFEVTSANQGITGDFSVQVTCEQSPELDVLYGGTNLTNYSTLDFGLTNNGATISRTITITNSGSETLTITNITVSPSSLFSINPTSITSIPTNGFTNLVITFNAISNGPQTGVVWFNNNDEFDDSPEGLEIDDPFVIYFEAFVNPPGVPPTIKIVNPTTNQVVTTPPVIAIDAAATKTNTASITQVVFRATGPAGITTIATGTSTNVTWANAAAGTYVLKATITDSAGRVGMSAPVTFKVNTPPVAVADRFTVYMKSTNFLDVLSNDTDANGDSLAVTNIVSSPTNGVASLVDGALFYAPSNNVFGRDRFHYAVADVHGARSTGTVNVVVLPSGSFLTILYTNTVGINVLSEITEPANITATASSDYLDYWVLEYRPRSSGPAVWQTLASAETNVQNSVVAALDPTLLQNGIYELRVSVFDMFGSSLDTGTNVTLVHENKIGHFTLAFTDLEIPVSGLPITLTRTYDSRNVKSGDFGVGWNLDVTSVRLEKSGIMGEGWQAEIGSGFLGFRACVYETEPHFISIVFPGDKVFRFRAVVDLNDSGTPCTGSVGVDAAWGRMTYAPLPGTVGTLREINPTPFLDLGFEGIEYPITFHDSRGTIAEAEADADSGALYDPKEFEFTTLDGRKFQFNAAGKVVKMTDRVGNSLTFSSDGVIHSSGKSVKFIRDAAGRIEQIYDPNGLSTNGVPTGLPTLVYKYDSVGNLEKVLRLKTRNISDPAYLTTVFGYTNSKYPHYLTDIDDPRGIKAVRNEYSDDGRLKSMTDASGKTVNYIHNVDGRKEIIVDRLGQTNSFVYDAKGNVTESVNALNHTNRFTYDANGNQLTHTDPLGHATTNTYDANDNLLSVTLPHKPGENPEAFTTRFTYDAYGNQITTTLPTGAVISNTVDTATGDLLAVRAGTNLITSFSYDAKGNLTAEGDRFGTNGFANDVYGNALFMTNTLGQVIESGYDANGNLTNLVDGGVTSTFQYDALGREAISDYGNGITLSNNFDSHLDWTSVDAPTIGHMERRFDEQGRLAGWTTVNGATPGFAYNANGQLEYETNSIGQVTYRAYDAAGRLTFVNNLTTGASSGSGYDAAGRRIAETNALGGFALYAYNPDGSLAAMTNAFLTNAWFYSYETGGGCCGGSGATTTVKDPLDREVARMASSYGLPLQTIRRASAGATGANAATNSITYLSGMVSPEQEAQDYPTAITDEGGRTRNLEYNSSGQLRRATDLSGSAWWTNWFAGPNNQLSRVDSPTRELTSYYYDALENVLAIKFPDNNSLTNFYDPANRLNGVRLPSGTLLTNFFDSAGRLTNRQARVNGAVTENVGLSYNVNDAVTIMTDITGASTNVFDTAGRLIGIDYPTGASVRYGHDLLGRMTSITNKASGGGTAYVTKYVYDALNQITEVIDHWNRTNRFEYDRVGRRTKRTLANGVVSEWQYNWKDQVTNLTHKTGGGTTLASRAYERLAGGEPSKITRDDGTYVELKYDSALRLTNEVYKTSGGSVVETIGYGYDLSGTRMRLSNNAGTFTNAVTAGYRVEQVKNGTTVTESYTFDTGGRITGMTRDTVTRSLGYNSADQLTAVTNIGTWVTYTHDGQGRRTVATNSAGTVRRFLTAPTPGTDLESPHLVANAGGTLQQGYVFLGDEPLLRFDSAGNPVYYLEDAMGSIVGLVSNGTSIATFTYDGFGNFRSVSGTTNAPTGTGGDFRFHGGWFEAETGLLSMRAREYDQRTGRFLSRDPIQGDSRVPETLNPYAFANNNPMVFTDSTGMEFTILGVNVSSAINAGLNAVKTFGVSYARSWARDKIAGSILDNLMSMLGSYFPALADGGDEFWKRHMNAGTAFQNTVRDVLCELGFSDFVYFEPGIREDGTPVNNGLSCQYKEEGLKIIPGVMRPDIVIGRVSPVDDHGRPATEKSWLIIETKIRVSSFLSYKTRAKDRRQFNATVRYAAKHGMLKAAAFVSLTRGKESNARIARAFIKGQAAKEGANAVVLSFDPRELRRKKLK